jgi:hypothetical protein
MLGSGSPSRERVTNRGGTNICPPGIAQYAKADQDIYGEFGCEAFSVSTSNQIDVTGRFPGLRG